MRSSTGRVARAATLAPRSHRWVAALCCLLFALAGGVWLVPDAARAVAPAQSVKLTVLDVTPTTPLATYTPKPLTITLGIQNTGSTNLTDVAITGIRGVPIRTQKALDAAISHPRAPDQEFSEPFGAADGQPVTVSVAVGQSTEVVVTTNTEIPQAAQICLCTNSIYPLYFTASIIGTEGQATTLGTVQTYVPVVGVPVPGEPALKKLQVSWVWPILDRPHRASNDFTFIDDDLSSELAQGGRLDRLLDVVEDVVANAGSTVPMTLVVDPDLIDELQVMTIGYTVQPASGPSYPGPGGPLAAAWLQRLRDVLVADPGLELDFTAMADPDVESLAANNLGWTAELSTDETFRISVALGGYTAASDIDWPQNETVSPDTLDTLATQGVKTVVLDSASMSQAPGTANALAPLSTPSGTVVAAVTSPTIQTYAADVVTMGKAGLADLPQLVSEVAMRALEAPKTSHYLVITPPRDADPNPLAASRAIIETSSTVFSTPLPLRMATTVIAPVNHGHLATHDPDRGLPTATISAATYLTVTLPELSSLFANPADRATWLGTIPTGLQRAESNGWVSDPAPSIAQTAALQRQLEAIIAGVHLVNPAKHTYTLTSDSAPIPVTMTNTLPFPVQVQVRIAPVNDLPGFTPEHTKVERVAAHGTVQVRVPTHVEAPGRIAVEVDLVTPSGLRLGPAVNLSVHSTALGTIGVIITIAAGVILVLALLFRVIRRLVKGPSGPTEPVVVGDD